MSFLSLQTWKKVWLVFKHMGGTTPRVVFDAYGHEYQFRSGLAPKYTFNLTGTVTPVVICQQNHKQVRHMFAVCPPGSRYLFECDSQFGLESWVEVSVMLCTDSDGLLRDRKRYVTKILGF